MVNVYLFRFITSIGKERLLQKGITMDLLIKNYLVKNNVFFLQFQIQRMQEMLAKMQAEMSHTKGINNNPPNTAPTPVPTTTPRSATTLPAQANGSYFS